MLESEAVHSRVIQSISTTERSTSEAATIDRLIMATIDITAIGTGTGGGDQEITADTITTSAMVMATDGDGVWEAIIEEVWDSEATAVTDIGHLAGGSVGGGLDR